MPQVNLAPQAKQDLSEIWAYIADYDENLATKFLEQVHDKCLKLAAFPEMGRACHELLINLRTFAIKNYIIFYLPIEDGVEILRVLRGARNIEKLFQETIDAAKEIIDEDN